MEYDEKWLHIVKSQVPENAKLIFQAQDVDGEYCRVISATKDKYDVVIVEGRDRVNASRKVCRLCQPEA